MNRASGWLASMAVVVAALPIGAQQPVVVVDDDDITIRGCVGRAGSTPAPQMIVWTRGDIMLSNAARVGTPGGSAERVFYWLEDEEDLAKHIGQMVEVKGDLGDFEKGELEVKRDGAFTDIELKLGGKTEKARVPTAWLDAPRGESDVTLLSRRIDVEDVKVLGTCTGQ